MPRPATGSTLVPRGRAAVAAVAAVLATAVAGWVGSRPSIRADPAADVAAAPDGPRSPPATPAADERDVLFATTGYIPSPNPFAGQQHDNIFAGRVGSATTARVSATGATDELDSILIPP